MNFLECYIINEFLTLFTPRIFNPGTRQVTRPLTPSFTMNAESPIKRSDFITIVCIYSHPISQDQDKCFQHSWLIYVILITIHTYNIITIKKVARKCYQCVFVLFNNELYGIRCKHVFTIFNICHIKNMFSAILYFFITSST